MKQMKTLSLAVFAAAGIFLSPVASAQTAPQPSLGPKTEGGIVFYGSAVRASFPLRVFIDKDTGCQYLFFNAIGTDPVAVTPRLGEDGKPVCLGRSPYPGQK